MFSQERFPGVWLLFQHLIGAVREKRRIALSHLGNFESVLEVGCSLGLVSAAFERRQETMFTGIDIDEQAISIARSKFGHHKHMKFLNQSLSSLEEEKLSFDFIMFGNVLHHVDDQNSMDMLCVSKRILKPNGRVLIVEPDILDPRDGPIKRFYYKLEKGKYRRSMQSLVCMTEGAGLTVLQKYSVECGARIMPGMKLSRMLVVEATFNPAS